MTLARSGSPFAAKAVEVTEDPSAENWSYALYVPSAATESIGAGGTPAASYVIGSPGARPAPVMVTPQTPGVSGATVTSKAVVPGGYVDVDCGVGGVDDGPVASVAMP